MAYDQRSLAVQSSPEQLLWDAVNALSPSEQEAFFGLAYDPVHLDPGSPATVLEHARPLAIFQTNAVSAGDAVGYDNATPYSRTPVLI